MLFIGPLMGAAEGDIAADGLGAAIAREYLRRLRGRGVARQTPDGAIVLNVVAAVAAVEEPAPAATAETPRPTRPRLLRRG
jgi:hypothetical protein